MMKNSKKKGLLIYRMPSVESLQHRVLSVEKIENPPKVVQIIFHTTRRNPSVKPGTCPRALKDPTSLKARGEHFVRISSLPKTLREQVKQFLVKPPKKWNVCMETYEKREERVYRRFCNEEAARQAGKR
jgi:hypothetical protein